MMGDPIFFRSENQLALQGRQEWRPRLTREEVMSRKAEAAALERVIGRHIDDYYALREEAYSLQNQSNECALKLLRAPGNQYWLQAKARIDAELEKCKKGLKALGDFETFIKISEDSLKALKATYEDEELSNNRPGAGA